MTRPNSSVTYEICGKIRMDFKTSEMYREHYRKHFGSEYKCSHCEKVFLTTITLKQHVRIDHCEKVVCAPH